MVQRGKSDDELRKRDDVRRLQLLGTGKELLFVKVVNYFFRRSEVWR